MVVAKDGGNKFSGMTQLETIASLDIESKDAVLNRYNYTKKEATESPDSVAS
jgi:hypothetical protein